MGEEWEKCMQALADSLRCPICMCQMRYPSLGACGHTLCAEHAEYIHTCPYPYCGKPWKNVKCDALLNISANMPHEMPKVLRRDSPLRKCMASRGMKMALSRKKELVAHKRALEIVRDITNQSTQVVVVRLTDEAIARLVIQQLKSEGTTSSHDRHRLYAFKHQPLPAEAAVYIT
jgi:hypothetical protein